MENMADNSSETTNSYKNPCLIPLLNQLYNDRNESGDVKFIVGGEEISAHRYVLAALSPKYKVQFYGSISDSEVIQVDDVSAAAFKEFLQFFYVENVQFTVENIEDVLNLAKQSLVDDLVELCSKFLIDKVKLETLSTYLWIACHYDLKKLQEKCDELISGNIQELFKSPVFLEFGRNTLTYILELDTLNCKEIEVFDACLKWARTVYKRENIDDANETNLRATIGDAFFNIRFGSMNIEEFAKIDQSYPNLFTNAEIREIYQQIGKIKEVESKFYNKRRIPQWNKCNILSEGLGEIFHSNFDSIFFDCSQAIDLHGFVMSAGPYDNFKVDIHDGIKWIYNHPKTIQKMDQNCQVMFEHPIHIRRVCKFKPGIHVKYPEIFAQAGYIPLAENAQNDIKFTFETAKSRTTRQSTISHLLFNRHD